MKRLIRILAVACVAALALAVSAAGASASTFTASETGELSGIQETNQVFTPGSFGSVTCKKAHTTGRITSLATVTQEVIVEYKECTGFGFPAEVSPAVYNLHANGEIDILNTITITVSGLGCKNTAGKQNGRKTVSYTNTAEGMIRESSNVSGIVSSGTGTCAGGSNGTYTGTSLVSNQTIGQTISWDA